MQKKYCNKKVLLSNYFYHRVSKWIFNRNIFQCLVPSSFESMSSVNPAIVVATTLTCKQPCYCFRNRQRNINRRIKWAFLVNVVNPSVFAKKKRQIIFTREFTCSTYFHLLPIKGPLYFFYWHIHLKIDIQIITTNIMRMLSYYILLHIRLLYLT